jgi:hypothetical protein
VRVLPGNLAELEVAHSTLPPQAATFACQGNAALGLSFTRVICGDLEPGAGARSLRLVESIVDGDVDALALTIDGCTVLGETKARTLDASNAIFVGRVQVERRQSGCVRFSFLPLESEAPRRFQCQPPSEPGAVSVVPQFASTTFGDPDYAMLAASCPPEIATGADDEGEMGAWHFLQAPQRVRNLRLALDEYLRFGLEAGVFFGPQDPLTNR